MDQKEINQKNKAIWEANAKVWDEKMGEKGNDWHLHLIAPPTDTLLDLQPDDHLLDVGCGNGIFARRITEKGFKVTAFDFSEENIKRAKTHGGSVDYFVIDATLREELQTLGNSFDKVVANMVLMDMPDLNPLFKYVSDVLTLEGSFVFSIQHPAFNSEFVDFQEEGLLIKNYIKNSTSKGVALEEQPEEQFYFHRPISEYSKLAFKYKFVIDAIEEPVFDRGDLFSKIPPVIIFRLRRR
ncbi:class I SAM-dependent DNA methyltransferase [Flammeovirga aprica]|uniref:Class I SAM-dependent methyltransferase n=1 Tax=Flammeovirga aprica JL-4 TaxID=694437 RepID=A0A7X9P404_9BACT|nr:class I SAM-dependent methyltransferase [Flammeovirga aprica]NME68474.1 class I SAM-dependent methyltransferase [Flammeovirga aprica JL-4]